MKTIAKIALLLLLAFTAIGQPTTEIPQYPFVPVSQLRPSVYAELDKRLSNPDFIGKFILYNELRGGECERAGKRRSSAYDIYANSPHSKDHSDGTMDFFRQAYVLTSYGNWIVHVVPTRVIGLGEMIRVVAKGRTMRALGYMQLLQMYAPRYVDGDTLIWQAPDSIVTMSNYRDIPRDYLHGVYDKVLVDLNYAETAFENSPTNGDYPKAVPIALKTRLLLMKGDYPGVITEAEKIVGSGPYSLEGNIATVFNGSYTGSEAIIAIEPQKDFDLAKVFYQYPGLPGGEYALKEDGVIADPNWSPSDARRGLIDTKSGKQYLKKYTSARSNVFVMRYAEVLLNYAEALARNDGGVNGTAVSLLNQVRQRSDPGTSFSPGSKQELINLILNERRIEFLGEGIRTPDIIRNHLNFPAREKLPAMTPADPGYIYNVPFGERNTNPAYHKN